MRFSGKTIVVTGAASGLGLAIANAAQAEGAKIVAIDRGESPFESAHICDVTDEGQVAGATLDALSNALNLAITFKDGQIQQHHPKDYPLATMAQLPDAVEVIVVPNDDLPPAGASFLAMPTAAPALANAVFRATAVRVRRLPLMKELLRLL